MSEVESIKATILETMHSEHCSYRSSRNYLAGLYTEGEHVIQGPGENAGIVRLGQGMAAVLRIESHNHPSFIAPFDGAATGIGGIIRDIFTMGARPIALIDPLRFGTSKLSNSLLKGVVSGISYYGNTIGIPVVGGEIFFDKTYDNNPLVNVCCVGLVQEDNIIYGNALTPGNDLIYVGARTGRDGIGGASFASRVIEDSEENKHAIQKGDPFLEKLLVEACVELAGTGWVEGMQDMGAAGLLCSTTEVALRGQKKTGRPIGARVYLNRVPTKAENMTPEELLISESQERMMIVGRKEHRDKILERFKYWDLEAVVVGEVTDDGNYTLMTEKNGQEVELVAMTIQEICGDIYQDWPARRWETQGGEYRKASANTTRSVWQQYDWRVGTRTVKGPNQPGHFAIMDIPEIGKELVIAWSSDEGRSDVDPAMGVRFAFDKTYRYLESLGAEALGLTNCLNFGEPEVSMGAFAQTTEELARVCREFEIPVVSGNVSLYNSSGITPIKPTPVLVMVGLKDKD